jgi:hypothetical protein
MAQPTGARSVLDNVNLTGIEMKTPLAVRTPGEEARLLALLALLAG